ncbi:MAG: hypothetical protein IQL11_00485 [Bacteroidales bacterium]|nr:hypothetical protein [Bacteroidales bacterium]
MEKKGSGNCKYTENVTNVTNVTRRRFITSCSACAACFALKPMSFIDPAASRTDNAGKMRIKIVYSLHGPVQTQPDWPNVGFDFNPVMEKINNTLKNSFQDIEFIPVLATGPEDAEKIIEGDSNENIDGYLVYQMNCWNRVVQTIAKTGKPVLYADFQYAGSGGFLVYTASFLSSKTPNVGFVASSRMDDLIAAAGCFKMAVNGGSVADFVKATAKARLDATPPAGHFVLRPNRIKCLSPADSIKQLKNSKIIAVRDQNARIADPVMGIPVEYIPFAEVNDAWSKADKDEAAAIAQKWQRTASEVIGVPFDTLTTSAAMYIGMKSVLKSHGAEAITINCLGGYYGGHIHAYPCLGFYELCNEGLVGACECDINSTATMLAFSTITGGRPGFISDPVIDTSKRQIIYAHCVAPSKMFGTDGNTNPIRIMTHSEDRNGASVQSILPSRYLTTTLEINNDRKEILFHQAVAVGNDPDDRACRTKLCAEPMGDIEKLFTMWDRWGWHRVTFYGDLREPVFALADAMGWKVTEEA